LTKITNGFVKNGLQTLQAFIACMAEDVLPLRGNSLRVDGSWKGEGCEVFAIHAEVIITCP